ncbi:polyamine oxidase 1-like [Temnothorax curvispinosus]|uniref:Polyamine oxidase 1-like n=1 Tax=Temnothorax curvispinosus TaxID=300111 RepID=A0A6J1PF90_9HYME|nr:polyamine oxidase 1-like [Temnothorax curvispinosus]
MICHKEITGLLFTTLIAVNLLGSAQSSGACDMPKETKIVIVGAGASGIAAASRLLKRGVSDFVILEANDRIGGRINTKNFGDNVVDLGAQWIHGGSGNVVFDLASKHDLLSSDAFLFNSTKYEFATVDGEIMPVEESSAAVRIHRNNMAKIKPEDYKEVTGSNGDYLIKK